MTKTVLLLILSFVFINKSRSQNAQLPRELNFVKLAGEVKLIDSQYLVLFKLYVTDDSKILVDKDLFFDQGDCTSHSSGRLFLKKSVRKSVVNITTNSLRQQAFSEGTQIEINRNHPLIDTVLLDNYYPLEIGDYLLSVEVDYSYKGTKYFAQVENILFNVPYLPPKSIFN